MVFVPCIVILLGRKGQKSGKHKEISISKLKLLSYRFDFSVKVFFDSFLSVEGSSIFWFSIIFQNPDGPKMPISSIMIVFLTIFKGVNHKLSICRKWASRDTLGRQPIKQTGQIVFWNQFFDSFLVNSCFN